MQGLMPLLHGSCVIIVFSGIFRAERFPFLHRSRMPGQSEDRVLPAVGPSREERVSGIRENPSNLPRPDKLLNGVPGPRARAMAKGTFFRLFQTKAHCCHDVIHDKV